MFQKPMAMVCFAMATTNALLYCVDPSSFRIGMVIFTFAAGIICLMGGANRG